MTQMRGLVMSSWHTALAGRPVEFDVILFIRLFWIEARIYPLKEEKKNLH